MERKTQTTTTAEDLAGGRAGSALDPKVVKGGDGARGTGLDADLQARIGRHLRVTYEEVARQPVPDRFIELLASLEGTTSAPKLKED